MKSFSCAAPYFHGTILPFFEMCFFLPPLPFEYYQGLVSFNEYASFFLSTFIDLLDLCLAFSWIAWYGNRYFSMTFCIFSIESLRYKLLTGQQNFFEDFAFSFFMCLLETFFQSLVGVRSLSQMRGVDIRVCINILQL